MPPPPLPPRWLLRRADQTAVAALVVAALAALAGWWMAHGGWRGGLIELDQARPLGARFAVDINTADWPELMQLPGIGAVMAHRIVESRATLGLFADHDALRRVRGIGPRTLQQIRPYLLPVPADGNVAKR